MRIYDVFFARCWWIVVNANCLHSMSVQKKLPGCIVVDCGLCTFQRVWIPESALSVGKIHG